MKQLSGKKLCKILERNGWKLERIKGSHHIYGKKGERFKLSVPVHGNKTLKTGLIQYFLRIAKITEES